MLKGHSALPRILLWETSDERVLNAVMASGSEFEPVALEGISGSENIAQRISPELIVLTWQASKPNAVFVPDTEPELAAAAVSLGLVDGAVGGVTHTSASVLRAGLRYIGADGTVSMAMLAEPPAGLVSGRRIMLADCAVVPHPTAHQMADTAIASAETWERITCETARVAFISSTTKAQEDTAEIRLVHEAMELVCVRKPDLIADGEMQIDAAIAPGIAMRKTSESRLGDGANVLVFPDLVSANAGYKLLQHLGGYSITPITQRMRRPFFDVSRGSSSEELLAAVVQCAALARYLAPKAG